MTDREKELQKYLDGLNHDYPAPFWKLAEILELQALEICHAREEKDILIPYMMNDAVENYLILKNCTMTGEYHAESPVLYPARLAQESLKSEQGKCEYLLSVRQEEENAFLLRFSSIEEKMTCYQYHRIGHFWVKGQEQWRQLVYIVGTIHDKYEYIGENICNDAEKELMPLIEFPPFRDWSPIHESLDGKYPFTYEGIDAMEQFAKESGDKSYVRLIQIYRKFPCKMLRRILRYRLTFPKSEALYRKIREKVEEASDAYEEREYGDELQKVIFRKRMEVDRILKGKGYQGKYPDYRKDITQIVVTEEHPFTKEEFEYDDYTFRMRFMVSVVKRHQQQGYLSGFFSGKGRIGWIAEDIEEIVDGKEA